MNQDGKQTGSPAGDPHPDGYFVMCSEKSVAQCATVDAARLEGQAFCDADPIPGTYYIEDAGGTFIEAIGRSDGKDLSAQIDDFNAVHRRG